jgi:hypothetical protein
VETKTQPALQHRSDSPAPARKSRRQAAVETDRASARVVEMNASVESGADEVDEEYRSEGGSVSSDAIATTNGPADEPSGLVKLKFATDRSFPEVRLCLLLVVVGLDTYSLGWYAIAARCHRGRS